MTKTLQKKIDIDIDEEYLRKDIGFFPHPGQLEVLKCPAREVVICTGRRWGKSKLCAYLVLKTILEPGKKVWIVAPEHKLTDVVFKYVVDFYLKAIPNGGNTIKYPSDNRPGIIKTPTGSILECRSTENPTGLLGAEVDLEIIDECSRIPRNVFNTYLYPVTASRRGRRVLISTPFGKNWFYEHFIAAKEDNAAFSFTSKDNPFLPEGMWEEAKEDLPEMTFKQEWMGMFLEDAATVFRGVREIISDTLKDSSPARHYLMGVDLARVNDFTVLTVIDALSYEVVAWERFTQLDYNLQKTRIKALADRYNSARIIIDSTGLGDPISEDLRQAGYVVDDFKISKKSKHQLIEKLMLFIERKAIRIPPIDVLIDELDSYSYTIAEGKQIKSDTIRYGVPTGKHDDCVISLALAVWGLFRAERLVPEKLGGIGFHRFDKFPKKKIINFEYL